MEHPIFTFLGSILSSTFVLSCIGALAGAAAGALGAQRVIERGKRKEELLKEIRNTNAAIMVAFTIVNTTLGLKGQLVKPMRDKFKADQERFKKHRWERRVGLRQGNVPYVLQVDFKNFLSATLPVDTLKALVYERINSYGKPLGIVAQVESAAAGLSFSIDERRRVIADFQANAFQGEALAFRYFGEMAPDGQVYAEYADLIQVISDYTDDLIFFSSSLADELIKHGKAVRSKFTKKFGSEVPHINTMDFSDVKEKGLFPSEERYASWAKWVVEQAAP